MNTRQYQQAQKAISRVEMMIKEVPITIRAHKITKESVNDETALRDFEQAGKKLIKRLRMPEDKL